MSAARKCFQSLSGMRRIPKALPGARVCDPQHVRTNWRGGITQRFPRLRHCCDSQSRAPHQPQRGWNQSAQGSSFLATLNAGIPLGFAESDGQTLTGTSSGDYATVVYRDDVYPISIALVRAGVRLRFVGIPGRSYSIERAPAVTGPWTTLNTQTAPASGLVDYLDAPSPPGQAFYRTVQP